MSAYSRNAYVKKHSGKVYINLQEQQQPRINGILKYHHYPQTQTYHQYHHRHQHEQPYGQYQKYFTNKVRENLTHLK